MAVFGGFLLPEVEFLNALGLVTPPKAWRILPRACCLRSTPGVSLLPTVMDPVTPAAVAQKHSAISFHRTWKNIAVTTPSTPAWRRLPGRLRDRCCVGRSRISETASLGLLPASFRISRGAELLARCKRTDRLQGRGCCNSQGREPHGCPVLPFDPLGFSHGEVQETFHCLNIFSDLPIRKIWNDPLTIWRDG